MVGSVFKKYYAHGDDDGEHSYYGDDGEHSYYGDDGEHSYYGDDGEHSYYGDFLVCDNCLDKMIYHEDAIKKYGLKRNQLCYLFYVDIFENSSSYIKYFEKDLYELWKQIIECTPKTDKQYTKLIKHKNDIEKLQKYKIECLDKKIDIENILIILFKKFDDDKVKLYQIEISQLISKYYELELDADTIAFQICTIIEEKMRNN
jgi:hypothetical protein